MLVPAINPVTGQTDVVPAFALVDAAPGVPNVSVIGGGLSSTAKAMDYWRRARARVVTGTGQGFLLLNGDSTTAGVGSNAFTNDKNYSTAIWLAKALTARGIPASADSFFGSNLNGSVDSRLVAGVDWTNNVTSFGGGCYIHNAGGSTTLVFTPTNTWNTVDVYYISVLGAGGILGTKIGGGAVNNFDTGATQVVGKVTYTSGSGAAAQALTFSRVSGGQVNVVGAVCYDSATPRINVMNAGVGGAKASDLNDSSFYSVYNAIGVAAADLSILKIGINDAQIATDPNGAYTTNVNSLVDKMLLTGDAILIAPNPISRVDTYPISAYATAMKTAASKKGVNFFDLNARYTSWAKQNALGAMNDSLHPNKVLYQDEANMLAAFLADA